VNQLALSQYCRPSIVLNANTTATQYCDLLRGNTRTDIFCVKPKGRRQGSTTHRCSDATHIIAAANSSWTADGCFTLAVSVNDPQYRNITVHPPIKDGNSAGIIIVVRSRVPCC
jgi:hypothetical protein